MIMPIVLTGRMKLKGLTRFKTENSAFLRAQFAVEFLAAWPKLFNDRSLSLLGYIVA